MFSDNDIYLFCKLKPICKINNSLRISVLIRVAEKDVIPLVTAPDLIAQVAQMGYLRF